MTGPEHYRRAEVLLESCQAPGEPDYEPDGTPVEPYGTAINEDEVDDCRNALMAAHVHATLALAAATLECASTDQNSLTQGHRHADWQTGVVGP